MFLRSQKVLKDRCYYKAVWENVGKMIELDILKFIDELVRSIDR